MCLVCFPVELSLKTSSYERHQFLQVSWMNNFQKYGISQLPSPTTSMKLSYLPQASASQNTNKFISGFSSLLNHKQVSEIIPTSSINMSITVQPSVSFLSITYVVSSSQLPIRTINSLCHLRQVILLPSINTS